MPANNSLIVTQGTQNNVAADQVGGASGTYYPYVRMDVGTLTNLAGGTFNTGTIGNGTISMTTGTLNGGTLTAISNINGTSYGTVGTCGAATWFTLVAAAGAGTRQYVSGLDIIVYSGTVDMAVTSIGNTGSVGNGVLSRGQYTPSTGISKLFVPAQVSQTNGTLAFWMGGAGTASVTVQFWQQ